MESKESDTDTDSHSSISTVPFEEVSTISSRETKEIVTCSSGVDTASDDWQATSLLIESWTGGQAPRRGWR